MPPPSHGREGIYFGDGDEHTLYSVGEMISVYLVELGKGDQKHPSTFSEEEINKYFGVSIVSS